MSEEERKALWEAVGVLCEAVDALLDIQAAAGNWVWLPEFEGDDTEDMEVTE